jgi:hypothetical protein
MAVSQRKMLGHYTRGSGGYKCCCCREDGTSRWRKTAERRELAELIAEETGPEPGEWLHKIGYLNAGDLLDCQHGCNGSPCMGGSCNFTCHPAKSEPEGLNLSLAGLP